MEIASQNLRNLKFEKAPLHFQQLLKQSKRYTRLVTPTRGAPVSSVAVRGVEVPVSTEIMISLEENHILHFRNVGPFNIVDCKIRIKIKGVDSNSRSAKESIKELAPSKEHVIDCWKYLNEHEKLHELVNVHVEVYDADYHKRRSFPEDFQIKFWGCIPTV